MDPITLILAGGALLLLARRRRSTDSSDGSQVDSQPDGTIGREESPTAEWTVPDEAQSGIGTVGGSILAGFGAGGLIGAGIGAIVGTAVYVVDRWATEAPVLVAWLRSRKGVRDMLWVDLMGWCDSVALVARAHRAATGSPPPVADLIDTMVFLHLGRRGYSPWDFPEVNYRGDGKNYLERRHKGQVSVPLIDTSWSGTLQQLQQTYAPAIAAGQEAWDRPAKWNQRPGFRYCLPSEFNTGDWRWVDREARKLAVREWYTERNAGARPRPSEVPIAVRSSSSSGFLVREDLRAWPVTEAEVNALMHFWGMPRRYMRHESDKEAIWGARKAAEPTLSLWLDSRTILPFVHDGTSYVYVDRP